MVDVGVGALDHRIGSPGALDVAVQLGLEIEIQEVSPGRHNVLARLGAAGARPHLILNGHTDTVPAGGGWTRDPRGELAAGTLYGRGSSDMKGGIASMIAAVEAIVRSGVRLNGSLTIAAVMDEEETGHGTRHTVEQGLQGDFAIIGNFFLLIALMHEYASASGMSPTRLMIRITCS